jgi:uncharacterized integral membrane protein (TIGR00698 family)
LKPLAGLAACVAIAAVAVLLGDRFPIVGAPVFSILMGVAIAAWRHPSPLFVPGVTFASKHLLQWSIVLLGAHLSLSQIARGGAASLPVMLSTFAIVLLVAYLAGRVLGIDRDLRRLLAIGTAICGGSAIAALSSVIDVDRSDVAYALGTVFLFNVVAVLTFPALGHALALSQSAFGLWAGTAINDTSSVVAAAFAYGAAAGNAAVVVKLTRTLLIVPVVGYYAWRRVKASHGSERVDLRGIFPWFIVWFLIAASINSLGWIPLHWQDGIQRAALYAIVVALAGVGLSSDVERMKSAGMRPLALGAILWVTIAVTSLAIARAFGLD